MRVERSPRRQGPQSSRLEQQGFVDFSKVEDHELRLEKQILEQYAGKVKNALDLSKQQCKVVLALSFYDLDELVELRPAAGSCYVLSASEPFNEEMEIDFEKLVNWLGHYGLPQYHVQFSGHVMPLQLKSILEEVNAAKVFPIHTENPELFGKFLRDLRGQVVLAEKGMKYRV
jgi:mRNA degradation ribonuclease J1/J2